MRGKLQSEDVHDGASGYGDAKAPAAMSCLTIRSAALWLWRNEKAKHINACNLLVSILWTAR